MYECTDLLLNILDDELLTDSVEEFKESSSEHDIFELEDEIVFENLDALRASGL